MIVIVDYGMGNLGSVLNMLKKAGTSARISSDPDEVEKADKIILPGVGAFDRGMGNLHECGLLPVLNRKALEEQTPILGICLGMQLLTEGSEEGKLSGLGWLKAKTKRFTFDHSNNGLKTPHMGWNSISIKQDGSLLSGFNAPPRFYFVHSYHVVCESQEDVLATTFYGYEFASAVRRRNIMGTQFHPEKSHKFGIQLLKNFIEKV